MTFLQQSFTFPVKPDYSKESFQVAPCNTLAFEALEAWPQWVDPLLLIHGPSFSGKTHLAHIWQQESKACFIHLGQPLPLDQPIILDALEPRDLTLALFHFLNRMREEKRFCLILAREHPLNWPCKLPDLMSRLKALISFSLEPPDDQHQAFLLQKNLSDYQVRLSKRQAHRLLLHTERSYEGIKSTLQSCVAHL